jgi:hypothetical protein
MGICVIQKATRNDIELVFERRTPKEANSQRAGSLALVKQNNGLCNISVQ